MNPNDIQNSSCKEAWEVLFSYLTSPVQGGPSERSWKGGYALICHVYHRGLTAFFSGASESLSPYRFIAHLFGMAEDSPIWLREE